MLKFRSMVVDARRSSHGLLDHTDGNGVLLQTQVGPPGSRRSAPCSGATASTSCRSA
jgi:hypothetical protein